MRLLLDTHVWLWTLTTPERLRPETLALLSDSQNELFLSVASCWEIAIKYRLGRLPLPEPPKVFIPARLARDGIHVLVVELHHTYEIAELPRHHNDPFDRMLVSQARSEGMTLVTADAQLRTYEVNLLPA